VLAAAACTQVAILCNHQRAIPRGHTGQMERLQERMEGLYKELEQLQHEASQAAKGVGKDGKKPVSLDT
jgi:DNA topoisomerase I